MGKNEGVKKMMEQWPLKVRGERVRDVRDSLGLSLRQLGDLCDLSVPALSRFERGELELSLGAFGRVQDALAELLSPENLIRNQKRFQEFASYFIGAIPEWKGVEPDAVVRAGIISFMRKRLGADWKDLVTAAWEVMESEKAAQVKKPGWLAGAIGKARQAKSIEEQFIEERPDLARVSPDDMAHNAKAIIGKMREMGYNVTVEDEEKLKQAMENHAATSECVLQEKIGRSGE